jgi:hypothetical protein
VLLPSQLSATSQSPALARHSVPALPVLRRQVPPEPLALVEVHALPSPQVVCRGARPAGGDASHLLRSQFPLELRQTRRCCPPDVTSRRRAALIGVQALRRLQLVPFG